MYLQYDKYFYNLDKITTVSIQFYIYLTLLHTYSTPLCANGQACAGKQLVGSPNGNIPSQIIPRLSSECVPGWNR